MLTSTPMSYVPLNCRDLTAFFHTRDCSTEFSSSSSSSSSTNFIATQVLKQNPSYVLNTYISFTSLWPTKGSYQRTTAQTSTCSSA